MCSTITCNYRSIFCLLSFLICIPTLNAQLASYSFNTNVEDQVGGHHATIFGSPNIEDDGFISFQPEDYLLLPNSLNSTLDISSSWQIMARFRVKGDYKATEAEEAQVIVSNKVYDRRFGGFDITAREWEGQLQIITTFGDGVYYEPNACPTCDSDPGLSEGKQDWVRDIEPDVWYDLKVKFIFDAEVPYIQYEVNGTVSISYFDDKADIEGIKQTMINQQIWVGADMNNDIYLYKPYLPKMPLDIDYLSFSSPIDPGDPNKVGTVLQTLTDQIEGDISLTAEKIDSLRRVFVDNWDDDSFSANKNVILSYMAAYEGKFGFIFDKDYKEKPEDFTPQEAILFIMQQWVLDNQYIPSKVSEMEGLVFREHEKFPGKVSDLAPRLSNQIFIIDGDYQTDSGFRLNGQEFAIRPTGYYVAPGELVTITVPNIVIDQGLRLFVGAQRKNVQETWTEFIRFPRIGITYKLNSQTITVANPFGGGIYVTLPDGSNFGSLEFGVDGAIKAPYYSTKPGFSNSLEEFKAEIANQYVPWVDMESSNFMSTIHHGMAATINDPDSVLSVWDKSFDAFNIALGSISA